MDVGVRQTGRNWGPFLKQRKQREQAPTSFPPHLLPLVASVALPGVRFPNSGTRAEGDLVPIVTVPRCPVAASSANWPERERKKKCKSAN